MHFSLVTCLVIQYNTLYQYTVENISFFYENKMEYHKLLIAFNRLRDIKIVRILLHETYVWIQDDCKNWERKEIKHS